MRLSNSLGVHKWPPETIASYELAHLGFYVSAPVDVLAVLPEGLSVSARIAELADWPEDTVLSVAGLLSTCLVRQPRRGELMAWLTLADARPTPATQVLREGAAVFASGRVADEETGGPRLFIDDLTVLGGEPARLSALAVAVENPPEPRTEGFW